MELANLVYKMHNTRFIAFKSAKTQLKQLCLPIREAECVWLNHGNCSIVVIADNAGNAHLSYFIELVLKQIRE